MHASHRDAWGEGRWRGAAARARDGSVEGTKPKTPSPRLLLTDSYHYCTVPYSGEDAILFVGLAVVAACLLRGKLATTLLLAAGAALQGVLAPSMGITLGRLGNAVSWFLSIVPVR